MSNCDKKCPCPASRLTSSFPKTVPCLACLWVSAHSKSWFLSLVLFQCVIFHFLVLCLVSALHTCMYVYVYTHVYISFLFTSCLRTFLTLLYLLQRTVGKMIDLDRCLWLVPLLLCVSMLGTQQDESNIAVNKNFCGERRDPCVWRNRWRFWLIYKCFLLFVSKLE